MTPLGRKMIRTMELRNFSKSAQKNHMGAIDRITRYYNKSPEKLTKELTEEYLLYLKNEKGNPIGTCGVATSGLRFFFKQCCQKRYQNRFSCHHKKGQTVNR